MVDLEWLPADYGEEELQNEPTYVLYNQGNLAFVSVNTMVILLSFEEWFGNYGEERLQDSVNAARRIKRRWSEGLVPDASIKHGFRSPDQSP